MKVIASNSCSLLITLISSKSPVPTILYSIVEISIFFSFFRKCSAIKFTLSLSYFLSMCFMKNFICSDGIEQLMSVRIFLFSFIIIFHSLSAVSTSPLSIFTECTTLSFVAPLSCSSTLFARITRLRYEPCKWSSKVSMRLRYTIKILWKTQTSWIS